MNVSVIIPAYNESASIKDIISRIRDLHPDFEIIVVNDGSEDETESAASSVGAIVYNHPYNIGNGAAIKSGMRIAKGDVFVFMDGDGQHYPEEIAALLSYYPKFDMIVGTRNKEAQASVGRLIGNRSLNYMASYVTKFPVEDLTSGFRVVRADIARSFHYLLPNTYSYPTTMTLSALRAGFSIRYVPITSAKRKSGTSNIRLFRDGVRFFMIVTKICTLYSPLRIFLPVSAAMFLAGLLRYLYTFIVSNRFTNMGALLMTTSIMIFMLGLISEQISQMRFERREVFTKRRKTNPPEKDRTGA